jgi:FG-GAP-like repeat/FG-GAP repeat
MTRTRLKLSTVFAKATLFCALLVSSAGVWAQNPVPFINGVSPVATAPGGADFTLTVNGAGFVPGVTVSWTKGTSQTVLVTSFLSGSKLTATVPSSLTATPGTALITVSNPGGPVASSAVPFPIHTPSTGASLGGPDIAMAWTPFSSVVGDFNGDGKLDVAEMGGDGSTALFAMLLGNGDGTFTTTLLPNTSFGTGPGIFDPVSMVAGDFNGDGKTDLAVLFNNFSDTTCASNGFVGVSLGNGDGTFSPLSAPVCVGIVPLSIVAADFNGDGKLDLAVANNCGDDVLARCSSGSVSVLLGNGDGTFTGVASPQVGTLVQAMTEGDFNGDGKVDLAVTYCAGGCNAGRLTVLLGNGDGSFTPTSTSLDIGAVPESIAAGDLNGDGVLDLIVANNDSDCRGQNCLRGSVTVLMGNGDGTFTAFPALNLSSMPRGLALGDFNGDGKLDVIAGGDSRIGGGEFTRTLTFLLGNGDGTFKASYQSFAGSFALSAGDFDGDGKLDLAVGGSLRTGILLQSLGTTFSASSLIFSPQPVGTASASQSVTLTNTGTRIESIGPVNITGDFGSPEVFSQTNTCGSSLVPGASCASTVTFAPPLAGPWDAHVVMEVSGGERRVSLTGVGGQGAFLSQSSLSFPVTLDATSSDPQPLRLTNITALPAPITALIIDGSFSQSNDCAGAVPAEGFCTIFVRFAPTVAGPLAGSLKVTVQTGDVSKTFVASLSGVGSALKLSPGPNSTIFFEELSLGATSAPQTVIVTDVSTQPLRLDKMTVPGAFFESDDCPRKLNPGASCTISVFFKPVLDGLNQGTLTVAADDPGSPETFQLMGTGMGTLRVVRLHYDYLVADNHTHDPEAMAPGAIEEVVKAFARHGIVLIIDPHHAAIPESALPPGDFPTVVLGTGNCGGKPGFVNLFDLKSTYYHVKQPRTHYVIFSHYIASTGGGMSCDPFSFSGFAELPGQNFVIAMSQLVFPGTPPSLQRMFVAGAFMHELGHNLGLHHGGAMGAFGDDRNFKPNYLSVMNYHYIFSGIPEADAVGSTHYRSCNRDRDCGGDGNICVDSGSPGAPSTACVRLDYSRQLLPTGGNTPGALTESDLSEPAGLGSRTADTFFFVDGQCNFQVGPSTGPVDWDGDGSPTNPHAAVDLIGFFSGGCQSNFFVTLPGFNDWEALTGNLDATEAQNEANSGAPQPVAAELEMEALRQKHLLYPPRSAEIAVHPGCNLPSAPLAPGQPGTVTITIPGTGSLNAREVDLSSLNLHGLKPLSATLVDANGDGRPDLILTFDSAQLHLSPQKKEVHLSGWLKNSQRFVANAPVTIVNDMSTQPAACQR